MRGDLVELGDDIVVGIAIFGEIPEVAVLTAKVAVLVGYKGELDRLVMQPGRG